MGNSMTDSATDKQIEKRQMFYPNDLRNIESFQDALRLLEGSGISVEDATEVIGDGFEMLDDKTKLVDQPFVILAWLFAPGDYKDEQTGETSEFCIMRLVTGEGKKYVVTDGSTGLSAQLRDYEQRTGKMGGLIVRRGLRRSDYENEHGPGTTFYLNV
jgi:hypothetical protein